jgi:hypothetical protein
VHLVMALHLSWHGCNVRLLTEVQSSSGESHETAAMTLPHAKAAAARPLRHEHDIHLESRRLLLSLIVAILCGSAQRTARRAPRQPEAPLLVKEVHEQE